MEAFHGDEASRPLMLFIQGQQNKAKANGLLVAKDNISKNTVAKVNNRRIRLIDHSRTKGSLESK